MTSPGHADGRNTEADFDAYADDARYDRALAEALSVSGESKEFFARGRVETVRDWLSARGALSPPPRVLDFGCGIGDTAPLLRELLGASRVTGVDPSARTLAEGRKRAVERVELVENARFTADPATAGAFDVCYTNGVFHHIPRAERGAAVDVIARSLRSGGRVFFWENHAGSPATRYVMARCAFDDDADPIWPHQARALLRNAGLVVEDTVYRFLFPRALSFLRPLEKRLLALPIGAQYVVVARKP